MIRKNITSILALISGFFVLSPTAKAMQTSSLSDFKNGMDFTQLDLSNPAERSLYLAVKKGAADISMKTPPKISEEIYQILNQINMQPDFFENPILIFQEDGILVTDPAKLEKVLSRPNQTMTSVVE